jgi:hypothetical protein
VFDSDRCPTPDYYDKGYDANGGSMTISPYSMELTAADFGLASLSDLLACWDAGKIVQYLSGEDVMVKTKRSTAETYDVRAGSWTGTIPSRTMTIDRETGIITVEGEAESTLTFEGYGRYCWAEWVLWFHCPIEE